MPLTTIQLALLRWQTIEIVFGTEIEEPSDVYFAPACAFYANRTKTKNIVDTSINNNENDDNKSNNYNRTHNHGYDNNNNYS